jgi:hypothetical protein
MARITSKQQKKSRQTDAEIEVKIQEARQALNDGTCKTIAAAAHRFGVPYHKLRGQYQHHTKPHTVAHVNQQLLTSAQEDALCDWVKYLGKEGQPMSKNMLCVTVADMSKILQERSKETGKQCLPDRKWVYAFMDRHPDLKLKRPTGLDPTRAQCFNPTVIKGHFELLGSFVTVSPSPQSKEDENDKLHKLREYARDFRRQHTTDAEQYDWDSDDGDYGLAIGRLVVT